MADFERKSDGQRIFTTEFKRQMVERIRSGETTAAALSRELSVAPALIRKWIKLSEHGNAAAVDADEDVVPAYTARPNIGRWSSGMRRLRSGCGRPPGARRSAMAPTPRDDEQTFPERSPNPGG